MNENPEMLFMVTELIKAYQESYINNNKTEPTETFVKTTMVPSLIASETVVELNELNMQGSLYTVLDEIRSIEDRKKKIQDQKAMIYFDQGITDNDEDIQNKGTVFYEICESEVKQKDKYLDPAFNTNLDLSKQTISPTTKKTVQAKLTNGVKNKVSLNLNKYLSDLGTNDITKYDVEKCLNCKVDFKDIGFDIPSLEWSLDFSQLLKTINDAIDKIKKELDPSDSYNKLCIFIKAFGKFNLCPSQLPQIAAILPALYVKYTNDIMKIQFDWLFLFGPIVKFIVSSIANLIENIPKITRPIILCLVNGVNSIKRFWNFYSNFLIENGKKVKSMVEGLMLTWNTLTEIVGIEWAAKTEKKEEKKVIESTGTKDLKQLEEDVFKYLKENNFILNSELTNNIYNSSYAYCRKILLQSLNNDLRNDILKIKGIKPSDFNKNYQDMIGYGANASQDAISVDFFNPNIRLFNFVLPPSTKSFQPTKNVISATKAEIDIFYKNLKDRIEKETNEIMNKATQEMNLNEINAFYKKHKVLNFAYDPFSYINPEYNSIQNQLILTKEWINKALDPKGDRFQDLLNSNIITTRNDIITNLKKSIEGNYHNAAVYDNASWVNQGDRKNEYRSKEYIEQSIELVDQSYRANGKNLSSAMSSITNYLISLENFILYRVKYVIENNSQTNNTYEFYDKLHKRIIGNFFRVFFNKFFENFTDSDWSKTEDQIGLNKYIYIVDNSVSEKVEEVVKKETIKDAKNNVVTVELNASGKPIVVSNILEVNLSKDPIKIKDTSTEKLKKEYKKRVTGITGPATFIQDQVSKLLQDEVIDPINLNAKDYVLLNKYGLEAKTIIKKPIEMQTDFVALYEENINKPVLLFLDNIINSLNETQTYIEDFTGSVINSLKAVNEAFNRKINLTFQLGGRILNLIHTIRFILLIYKLIQKGFSDCEKISTNIAEAQSIVNSVNPDIKIQNVPSEEAKKIIDKMAPQVSEFDNVEEKKYMAVTSLSNQNSTLINVTDCNNISSKMRLDNDENLNKLYEEMLNAFITT